MGLDLTSLEWRSFERYPPQGKDVFIYFKNEAQNLHKFFKITQFNAVSFSIKKLTDRLPDVDDWEIMWFPADLTENENDN